MVVAAGFCTQWALRAFRIVPRLCVHLIRGDQYITATHWNRNVRHPIFGVHSGNTHGLGARGAAGEVGFLPVTPGDAAPGEWEWPTPGFRINFLRLLLPLVHVVEKFNCMASSSAKWLSRCPCKKNVLGAVLRYFYREPSDFRSSLKSYSSHSYLSLFSGV